MFEEILSDLIITKVRSATTMYSSQNRKVKRNDRPCWAIVMKYEGETVYTSCGKRFLSDANHIVILPKGCSYDFVCNKEGHFCIIEFESDSTFDLPLTFSVKNSENILKAFKSFEYKRNLKTPMSNIESIRDAYSLILLLLHSDSKKYLPSDKQQRLLPVMEYILHNYDKNITNDMLAEIMGVSTVYFRKLFSEVTGVSPIAYIKRLRIEKAKDMLQSDYASISVIAQSLGYANLYDFSRDFKKHTGVAPSKFYNMLV